MSPAAKLLIFALGALLTMLGALWLSGPPAPPAPPRTPDTPHGGMQTPRDVESSIQVAEADSAAGKYYFDVVDHSAEEFLALLKRARTIYDQAGPGQRAALEIVLVVHGPDIDFFLTDHDSRYQEIVDTAARLDALGVFDFKICTMTANRLGVTADDVPDFIEFVPFGPGEIDRLEAAGFARL